MRNLKNLTEEEIETLEVMLEVTPVFDFRGERIELSDLEVSVGGDIIYLYSYDVTEVGNDDASGYNSILEYSNEEYQILVTAKKLKELVEKTL